MIRSLFPKALVGATFAGQKRWFTYKLRNRGHLKHRAGLRKAPRRLVSYSEKGGEKKANMKIRVLEQQSLLYLFLPAHQ